jgi:predicted amidohydrolase YtcJ
MRRSMAELAASFQSGASDNSPLELPPPTQRSPATSLEGNAGVNINSSLSYANALADARVPLSVSSEAADRPREQEVESEMLQQRRQLLVSAEAAQKYRAKAFELMTANVKANLDYANKLGKLRTPLDFIELSTTHARKQFELIMSHATAVGAFSRSLTMANAERMSAGIERVFDHGHSTGPTARPSDSGT